MAFMEVPRHGRINTGFPGVEWPTAAGFNKDDDWRRADLFRGQPQLASVLSSEDGFPAGYSVP
ncbi:hypothetical protein D3C79_873320 [compost metagenome]